MWPHTHKTVTRETYAETAIRMDGVLTDIVNRLKAVVAESSNIGKDSLDQLKELTIYVNYQDGSLKTRIKRLEDTHHAM